MLTQKITSTKRRLFRNAFLENFDHKKQPVVVKITLHSDARRKTPQVVW